MKLPTFFYYKYDEHTDTRIGIGIEWMLCREGPYRYTRRPDCAYYDYIALTFKFVSYFLQIDIFYKKMPYKNYEQYLTFIKGKRNENV